MNKTENDLTLQNELLVKIKNAIELLDEIDDILDRTPIEQSRCDSLKSDYLHIYENYELTDEQMISVSKKVHDVCVERRNWNNIALVGKAFRDNANKIGYKNQRPFLVNAIQMVVKNLNQDYKDRVLSEDDKKELLSIVDEPINVRRGYKKVSDQVKEEIILKIKQNVAIKDIAKEYSMKYATLYKWKKDLNVNI